jgi:hypothetical protein
MKKIKISQEEKLTNNLMLLMLVGGAILVLTSIVFLALSRVL